MNSPINNKHALAALLGRLDASRTLNISALNQLEPQRAQQFCVEAAGLYCDFSRSLCSADDLQALLGFAEAGGLRSKRDAMLRGDRINTTENRAVLHTALRQPDGASLSVDGQDVLLEVHKTLDRIANFCDRVRHGEWLGADGRRITDIVNIGIGGSYLGPELACDALRGHGEVGIRVHFLSSLDPAAWQQISHRLDPNRTLGIVASKSWKTLETTQGALAVRDWLLASGIARKNLHKHLAAVSTNVTAATEFGIAAENVFPFWDWVGGRYSLWSAIGLPVMLQIGPPAFRAMLAGAHAMDQHFANAPLAANAPVLHALISWWQTLVTRSRSEAILPYSYGLRRLPAYLQQLSMESNGKSVDLQGRALASASAPVTWGEPGTEAQHSFFQLLHQGSDAIPVEFILPLPGRDAAHGSDLALVANCLAQADALAQGRSVDEVQATLQLQGLNAADIAMRTPHMVYPGNRPSSMILMNSLDPASFGALIALYEHRTAVLGMLWNINSFDQWGVEVGKQRATSIQPLIENPDESVLDELSSANRVLFQRIRKGLSERK